jgi:hypothetical protein
MLQTSLIAHGHADLVTSERDDGGWRARRLGERAAAELTFQVSHTTSTASDVGDNGGKEEMSIPSADRCSSRNVLCGPEDQDIPQESRPPMGH